jgi:hypothetical protein
MSTVNQVGFSGWEIVAISSEMDYHTLTEMATVFISGESGCYYLYDELLKMQDVTKMPSYISEDWVNYNKKELNIKILDKYIKEFADVPLAESQYIASELKCIKRDLLLKKII